MTAADAVTAALALARGSYQEGILLGRFRLSGADLEGKAREYGARYARSRAQVMERILDADLPVREVTGAHGFRFLIWGCEALDAEAAARAAMEAAVKAAPGNTRVARAARAAARAAYYDAI